MNDLFDFYEDTFKTKGFVPECLISCSHDFVQDDGVMICLKCSLVEARVFVSNHDYTEPSYSAYKRITHIKSNLTRFIGQEDFYLPDSVLSIVKKFNPQSIKQVRSILKYQGLSKYYIHIYAISTRIGIPIPFLCKKDYDKIVYHFNLFNGVYSKIYSGKNCLNYHFLLSKIFQKIGRNELLSFLNFGTNKNKISHYEKIWTECSTYCM